MELTLELKQTHKLSPQMIHSMEILQMGTQELQTYVEKILMENPTLELESEERREERPELVRKLEWLVANDRQNRWYHQEDARDLSELLADTESENLYDHLRTQLDLDRMPVRLSVAVDCILAGLNHAGYLEESREELAARCGQPLEIIASAEKLVQSLEPAGVGARSLSECLALQLERLGERGLPLTIVQNYLEDMARNHYRRISLETGAGREEIQRACQQIRALDPKPGSPYAPREAPSYITADLFVLEEDGKLVVTASDEFLPVLKVSSYYQQLLKETDDPEVDSYLTEKVRQAKWVVKSIEQRRSTLVSCADVIVARQERFFRSGAGHLRPMTLADVAGELGVHESTVSRAIKDKYLQCSQGLFPLTYFFSRALMANDSEGVSPEKAKNAIRCLIEQENKRHPISDQKLCDLLAEQDIQISRRTVAKYRDELGIPSTSGRKEF